MPDQRQTNQTSGMTRISRDAGVTWLGAIDANGTKQGRNLEMQWTEKGLRRRRSGETATNGANVFPVVWSDINKWRQGKSLCDRQTLCLRVHRKALQRKTHGFLQKTLRPTVRRSLLVINLGVISILCNDAAEKQQLLEEELAHLLFLLKAVGGRTRFLA